MPKDPANAPHHTGMKTSDPAQPPQLGNQYGGESNHAAKLVEGMNRVRRSPLSSGILRPHCRSVVDREVRGDIAAGGNEKLKQH